MYHLQQTDGRYWLNPNRCFYTTLHTQAWDWLNWRVNKLVRSLIESDDVQYLEQLSITGLADDLAAALDIIGYDDTGIPDDVYLWVMHYLDKFKEAQ